MSEMLKGTHDAQKRIRRLNHAFSSVEEPIPAIGCKL